MCMASRKLYEHVKNMLCAYGKVNTNATPFYDRHTPLYVELSILPFTMLLGLFFIWWAWAPRISRGIYRGCSENRGIYPCNLTFPKRQLGRQLSIQNVTGLYAAVAQRTAAYTPVT